MRVYVCGCQSAEWCGPDGSVVLIRAVRSGLDRVVLELLRAGVPVNNTDHTGNYYIIQRKEDFCVRLLVIIKTSCRKKTLFKVFSCINDDCVGVLGSKTWKVSQTEVD